MVENARNSPAAGWVITTCCAAKIVPPPTGMSGVRRMLLLGRSGAPGSALPVIGGVTFTALTGLWLTSSLWFFTTIGLTF